MSMTLSAAKSDAAQLPQAFFAMAAQEPRTLHDYLGALQPFASRLLFARGETIFCEGDAADYVYKVVNGTVRLCRYVSDGRRHVTDFALPGDLIGFLECPDQPVTAEAIDAVTIIAYPRSAFDRLAAGDAAVRSRLLCHLSSALLEAQRHLFVLGCQSAKERVASFLLRMSDRLDVFPSDRFELPMGRQDIADHLGITIETVCRAISALKAEGFLAVPNARELILTNVPALRALAIEC